MANKIELERFDPSNFHKDCIDIFRAKQWLTFLEKFNGHNELTTRNFASSFIGKKAIVGNLSFRVSEDTISQAIDISPKGDKYFKTKQFKEKTWAQFISRTRESLVDWKLGIHRSWPIHPWDEIFYIIQKFITYEGRYNNVFLYHIKL